MSTARTFTPITGGGTGGAYQVGDKFGYQTVESIRQSMDQAAYNGGSYDLGGSDDVGLLASSYASVIGAREVTLNGDALGGLTLEAIVYSRTLDASTSVTLRVRNLTDSSTSGTSTVVTTTALTKQAIALTLASGVKTYRLEIIASDALNAVFGFGTLRLRKVPA